MDFDTFLENFKFFSNTPIPSECTVTALRSAWHYSTQEMPPCDSKPSWAKHAAMNCDGQWVWHEGDPCPCEASGIWVSEGRQMKFRNRPEIRNWQLTYKILP
jgi:hypothetical protein